MSKIDEYPVETDFDLGFDPMIDVEYDEFDEGDTEIENLMAQIVAGEANLAPTDSNDREETLTHNHELNAQHFVTENIQDSPVIDHNEGEPDQAHDPEDDENAPEMRKRFKSLSAEDLAEIEKHKDSESTKRNTKWGLNLFAEWCIEAGYPVVDFEIVDPNYLANLLREFYGSAAPKMTEGRQKSLPPNQANEYHKNTMKNLRAAINRHLRNLGSDIDIVKDRAFAKANALLDAKLKLMVKSGASRPTQHKKIITNNDLLKISTYLHNDDDPQILQYKVWYYLAIHFVSRGLEFHHQLSLHSFLFLYDDTGREYVTLAHETQQKNIQGGLSNQESLSDKRMYATCEKGCPVGTLRKFLSHCDPCAPALFCRLKVRVVGEIWYTCKPLSKRLFSKFMIDICQNAECSMTYTAHSVRATAIQLLSNSGVETRHIMLMSGHRNEASVRSYSRDCSESQKRDMSDRLANVSHSSMSRTSTSPMSASEQLQTVVSVSQNNVSVPNSLATMALPSHSFGSEASQLQYMNSMTSLSTAQGILTHSSFSNCQFSFVLGKNTQ